MTGEAASTLTPTLYGKLGRKVFGAMIVYDAATGDGSVGDDDDENGNVDDDDLQQQHKRYITLKYIIFISFTK